jgi:GTP-binding protein EngB required for normal cell division
MVSKRERRQQDENASMIVLMGSTGSGKSYFINKLKEGSTVESDSLYSCTATCQLVQTRIGRTNVAVVDCPGFNDTRRSDTEILAEIAKVLSSQYLQSKKLQLRGILYLRDISKTRMEGSDIKTLKLFTRLVGRKAFPHVVLVTTMWSRLGPNGQSLGERKEMELKEDFWKEMILDGSYVQRFAGTKDSAEGIISQLIGDEEPVVLQIQRQLIDEERRLAATSAGSLLAPIVAERLEDNENKIQRYRERLEGESNGTIQRSVRLEIEKAEKEKAEAESDKNTLKEKVGADLKTKIREAVTWQDAIRTLCSVVGVSLSIAAAVAGTGGCVVS